MTGPSVVQPSPGGAPGGDDAFVTKINAGGTALVYSTYLGGPNQDNGWGIAVDSSGNAYVTGFTQSPFPGTSSSPVQSSFGSVAAGVPDAFVAEINAGGTALVYSTYLGGSGDDRGTAIAVDSSGSAYVTGSTNSPNFPGASSSSIQSAFGGSTDVFVTKIGLTNTPAGTSVAVQPVDPATISSPVALTFSSVSQAGATTLTTTSSDPAPPQGFALGSPATYYNLVTTAAYTGSITICINYSGISYQNPSALALFHYEGGAWVNVTTSLDTGSQVICGSVSSLSPFAVFTSAYKANIQQPINPDNTSVFSATKGAVPVKFTLTSSGAATCNLPPATISLARTAGGTIGAIDESVYEASADTGSSFRIDSCQYVYNLGAKSLGVGTYLVQININGAAVGNATFGLK